MKKIIFGIPITIFMIIFLLESQQHVLSKEIGACLVTKTDINPFFVKMKEGAAKKAHELGVNLSTYAGKVDGDHETQVQAIESCIASGAKGILLATSDTKAIVPIVQKARKSGLIVIALDNPLEPMNAANATFATSNFKAGQLIGEWAAKSLGKKLQHAKIALLDLTASAPSVDVLRDQGFMKGFGIDIRDPKKIGDEIDARIVGHDVTNGNEEGGRRAMENLMMRDPEINVVYTVNEPAAAGAYEALKSFGMEKGVVIVSIDGGCPGISNIKDGIIGATSQQYPITMASEGINAIYNWVVKGKTPKNTKGLNFFDTGISLVTDNPVKGVHSISTSEGFNRCWG